MSVELVPVERQEEATPDPRMHGLVLRHLRRGDRVVLLGAGTFLRRDIEGAGCSVVVFALPLNDARAAALEAVRRFQPDALVLIDDFAGASRSEKLFRDLLEVAPRARFLLGFWNASSTTAILGLLEGEQSPPGVSDDAARRWFAALGLSVLAREVLPSSRRASRYPVHLARALGSLFRQLNPTANDERLFYVVARSAEPSAPRPAMLEPGLLSVVMRNHSRARLALLDHAIFSLACQEYRPLEIVVASQCNEPGIVPALEDLLGLHQHVGRYRFRIVHEPSSDDIRSRLLNLGINAAHGQYIAFLDDDDVVYPHHYRQLVSALQASGEGWAFARARRAYLTRDPSGALYCQRKADVFSGDAYDRSALIRDNFITSHSYVIDRERLGRFPLRFSEAFVQLEDYVLLLELSALFPPAFVPGPASCEYRIRDDGSNTVLEGATKRQKNQFEAQWQFARLATDLARRSIQTLASLEEWDRHVPGPAVEACTAENTPASPLPLRYSLADRLNLLLKGAPAIHRFLRRIASGVSLRPSS